MEQQVNAKPSTAARRRVRSTPVPADQTAAGAGIAPTTAPGSAGVPAATAPQMVPDDTPANGLPPVYTPETVGSEKYRIFDRMGAAWAASLTGGLSPMVLGLSLLDWAAHLAAAPGKRLELVDKAQKKTALLLAHLYESTVDPDTPPCIEPLPGDYRFSDPRWKKPPFCYWAQAFLLQQQWWHNATHNVPGVNRHHEEIVSFTTRQMLDLWSPSNSPLTNPEVIARTVQTGGMNLVQGALNWTEDAMRQAAGWPPVGAEEFKVGENTATTPGKVVFRNHLIELIQFAPTTDKVIAEPVLIVPAWIMKYYILDLSPHNSLIRWLVEQGHTVFCVSWRNPGSEDRDLTMDDYRRMGVAEALDAVGAILPDRRIHGIGYCLGGTLLTIAAAAMAHSGDDRLAGVTLLAAQTDFSEPGELGLFIDDSQLHLLQSMMWSRGYLSANQMAGAFQLLRSNDLVWSRMIHDYLIGKRSPMIDLMAWNADSTRMPYRMHAEYLQRLYLDNELAAGRIIVDGRPAAVQNIRAPMFVVGTERDHVAPWRSVYKIHYLADTDVTFVLTSGGHNAGIVSEPGRPRRRYRIALQKADGHCLDADTWVETAEQHRGSWWPALGAWLAANSSAERVDPPRMGAPDQGLVPLGDAPGTYVFQA